ncbi:hypothetical protein [Chryseobacterium oranimense]|jgi:hypothetical protein|uniref:hypothetical protein n=1 Tax=Chryseobacterium oranimense TaxID=421058 RepID=UPI0022365490|nr:hypothetical protein [Chryseobacterium oranimense]
MRKKILVIVASLLVLFFSLRDLGYIFISLPVFILLAYSISNLITELIDKKKNRIKKEKDFEYLFLFGLVPFLLFGKYYENTIGGYELFWKLAFTSIIFTGVTILVLNFLYNFNSHKKRNNILSIVIFFFFLVPAIGILINKQFTTGTDRKEKIEINRKYINKGSRGSESYEIFIKTRFDEDERLEISENLYKNISDNQIVELNLSRGILGYDYVEKVKKYNSY